MKRNKKRIFAGNTCDQIIYCVSDSCSRKKDAKPIIRFNSTEEREKHKRGIALRHCIRLMNHNFTPNGYYGTFTFNQENEIYDFESAKRVRAAFIRKIRSRFPDVRIMAFLGRGKKTLRIHLHIVFENADPETVKSLWQYGDIKDITPLHENCIDTETREEIGTDYTALATYLFNHWTLEQKGHYYSRTKNMRNPEEEKPTECKANYSPEHPPQPPKGYKFIKCTWTKYGYLCFHYVKKLNYHTTIKRKPVLCPS